MVYSQRIVVNCVSAVWLVALAVVWSISASMKGDCASLATMESNYTVELVRSEDVPEIMSLLQRTFYLDEPLNKATGLCDNGADKCEDLDQYCKESLLEGLSLKAVDPQGKVVGVMITGVLSNLEGETERALIEQTKSCKSSKFVKILHILIQREHEAQLWRKFPRDKQLAEVKIAATEKNWRRKGIMNTLLEATEKITKERHIRLLRMDTSSEYSAMAAERLGFDCVYQALYSDIKIDGRPIIVPEPPHLYDRVYIKPLF